MLTVLYHIAAASAIRICKIFLEISFDLHVEPENRLLFSGVHIIIYKLAEMSEWFKEHDWKSCDGGDSSGGSNPLLCASKNLS